MYSVDTPASTWLRTGRHLALLIMYTVLPAHTQLPFIASKVKIVGDQQDNVSGEFVLTVKMLRYLNFLTAKKHVSHCKYKFLTAETHVSHLKTHQLSHC